MSEPSNRSTKPADPSIVKRRLEEMAKSVTQLTEAIQKFKFKLTFIIGDDYGKDGWWRNTARRERMAMERRMMKAQRRSERNRAKKRKHGRQTR